MSVDDRVVDDYERAAGGMEYDEEESHASLAETLLADGPEALFEEIEDLVPERWREQIAAFPLTAVALGLGIGIFLGMKKGDELLAAGSAMVSAAATANLNKVLSRE